MQQKQNQKKSSFTAIRVKESTLKVLKSKLELANNRDIGRKVKPDELISLALSKVADKEIQLLQKNALTFTDKKKLLRLKYIEVNGPITPDEFEGFTMTPDFHKFYKEHARALEIA